MKKMNRSVALSLAAMTAMSPAFSAQTAEITQPHEAILLTAQNFLEAQLKGQDVRSEIQLGTLDPRLRLAACDRPLEGFLPAGARLSGNTSIGVACNGTQPWKLYVQAYVAVFKTVAVAADYLAAGAVPGANNIRLEERDVTSSGYGYLTDLEQLRGKVVKQPVQEGRIVPPQALSKVRLVRRGEEVTLVSRNGNIEVRMPGNALMDGAEGDLIKVRNVRSKRIIQGRVDAAGLVMVSM
jgi:flagella basal body P-ring formation protein FlgA